MGHKTLKTTSGSKTTTGMSYTTKKFRLPSFHRQLKTTLMPNIQTVSGRTQIPNKCKNQLLSLNDQAFKNYSKVITMMKQLLKRKRKKVQHHPSASNSQPQQSTTTSVKSQTTNNLSLQTMQISTLHNCSEAEFHLKVQPQISKINSYIMQAVATSPTLPVLTHKTSAFKSTKCLRTQHL
jgi:hypothetical protein